MKKIFVLVAAALLALGLVGCSGGSNASSSTNGTASATQVAKTTSAPQPLELSEACYVTDNGYVYYTVAVQNPNTDYMADFATITVTGKDADGKVAFNDDWVIGTIMPGTTTYWANQAGHGDVSDDLTIDLSVSVSKSNWKTPKAQMPADLYTFENTSLETEQFGHLRAAGEVTIADDSLELGYNGVTQPMIVCVLRDADGNLVDGFNGYLTGKELVTGQPTAFEISSYHNGPDYETYELHANPWM